MNRKFPLRGASRRQFVQSVLSASAALGLGPTRAMELLDSLGGSALAQAAMVPRRTVNIIAGRGGFAWFHFLWPFPKVISQFQSGYAYDNPANAILVQPGDSQYLEGRKLYVRGLNGKKLWDKYGERKLVSCFVAGDPKTHDDSPRSPNNTNTIVNGATGAAVGMFAAAATIQSTLKSLVPSIGINFALTGEQMPYGTAPGAPAVASVANANAMIDLFSTAAARRAERLLNKPNQDAFDQFHKAFLGLTRTATRPTYQRAYGDAKVAASLLAQNVGEKLRPTANQAMMWCGNPTPTDRNDNVIKLAEALIVTANAFKLGLTSQVTIPAFHDDPHSAFANMARSQATVNQLVNLFNTFMDELALSPDPTTPGKNLSDNIVMTVSGDTGKTPYMADGWPDNPPANWLYVMSQGRLKPGWYGSIEPPPGNQAGVGSRLNWNPATGQTMAGPTNAEVLDCALAGVLYAVTNGDDRRVRDFFNKFSYTGITNPLIT